MSWQSGSINPATTSPLADISRIKNDLSVLKGVIGGTQDADVPFKPYAGTAARITGDFSNATIPNRVMFQTSVANGNTSVGAIPNGTSTASNFSAFSASDPTNSSAAQLTMNGTEARLSSTVSGSGTYLPMTFHTGGNERMRIDTSGNVGIGGTSVGVKLDVFGNQRICSPNTSSAFTGLSITNTNTAGGTSYIDFQGIGGVTDSGILVSHATDYSSYISFGTQPAGAASDRRTNKLAIDGVGNVLALSPTGGLGYGTGAGGTVTQSTSKSTAVTLNKPCGQITMNNAALAAGAEVSFTVNNTLVTTSDSVLISPLWATVSPLNYQCRLTYVGGGTFGIAVKNISAGSLSEALVINFAIIKGATS